MTVTINGSGTVTGITAGGLPNGIITQPEMATGVAGTGPAFSAYAGSSQTVTSGVITKVAINTTVFDTNSNFDTTAYRFTPTVAGYYQVNGLIHGQAVTTFTIVGVYIYKNGTSITRSVINASLTANQSDQINISELVYMNGTTDYLELYGLVTGTGTTSFPFQSVNSTSRFSACLVRAA